MASVISAGTASNTALTLTSDTTGELQLKTNSGSTTAMTLTTGGNVGIGTSSPAYTLEVATGTSGQQSLANFRTADSTAANNAGLQIFATPSATAGSRNILVSWDADGANTSGGDYFYIQKLGNSGNVELAQYSNAAIIFSTNVGTERMRITSGGNVGINTSAPQLNTNSGTFLTVVGTNASAWLELATTSTTDAIGGVLSFNNTNVVGTDKRVAQINSGRDGANNKAYLQFYTANAGTITERMRIDSSGNVGIGTSTITSGGGWSPRLVLAGADTALIVKGSGGQESSFGTSGGLYLDCLGNSAGPNNNIVFRNTNVNSSFSALERMRIHAGGNVSIGNTTNTYNLDVTGSIRASTYFYASGGNAGDGIYLANGSSNGLIAQISNGGASTTTYIGNQTITTSSDIRIKNNVRPTERNALELLGQWEIVDHTWNDPSDQCENNRNSRGVWTGVIAQQIQPITPWLVNKPLEDENKDGSKNLWLVDFAYSVPLLVKAIQEQQAMIEELTNRIKKLEGV